MIWHFNSQDRVFSVTFPHYIHGMDITVNPVLSGHSKKDKTKVFKTGYRLILGVTIAAKNDYCDSIDIAGSTIAILLLL